MRSIGLSRTAVLGVPFVLAILAVEAFIVGAPSGLRDPLPFLGLCLAAGVAFFVVGITMLVGSYEFFASRRLELLVSGLYVFLGAFGVLVALLLLVLINSCLFECI